MIVNLPIKNHDSKNHDFFMPLNELARYLISINKKSRIEKISSKH